VIHESAIDDALWSDPAVEPDMETPTFWPLVPSPFGQALLPRPCGGYLSNRATCRTTLSFEARQSITCEGESCVSLWSSRECGKLVPWNGRSYQQVDWLRPRGEVIKERKARAASGWEDFCACWDRACPKRSHLRRSAAVSICCPGMSDTPAVYNAYIQVFVTVGQQPSVEL